MQKEGVFHMDDRLSKAAGFTPAERAVYGSIAVLIAGFVAFHATMVTLFCLPPNPLGEALRPIVLAYTHPYFEQYWNVFAPQPPTADVYVLARTKRMVAGQEHITQWVNVSEALLQPLRIFPVSPISELRNDLMNATVAVKNDRTLYKRKFSKQESVRLARASSRPLSLEALENAALYFGADTLGDARDVRSVQIAIVEHTYPRFTERWKPDDPAHHNLVTTFPWSEVSL
jgi:hypothetical protein